MSLPTHQLTCQPGSAVEPHGEAVISAVWFFQSEEFPYVVFSHFYLYMNFFFWCWGSNPVPDHAQQGVCHTVTHSLLCLLTSKVALFSGLWTDLQWILGNLHTEYTFWAKEVYSVGHTLLPPVGVITSGSVVCVCVFISVETWVS